MKKIKTRRTIKRNTNKKIKSTIVSFLLDRTGSMRSVLDSTISGFNEYTQTLKADKKNKYSFSLTIFDSKSIDLVQNKVSADNITELNKDNFIPRDMTNLYDAIGKTITNIGNEKDVLFIVMTDGQENDSKEYTRKKVFDLIKQKEKLGWKFVYLGANQDAYAIGQDFGILKQNTVTYNSTDKGTKKLYRSVADSTVMYASAVSEGNLTKKKGEFFSLKQQADIENTK